MGSGEFGLREELRYFVEGTCFCFVSNLLLLLLRRTALPRWKI